MPSNDDGPLFAGVEGAEETEQPTDEASVVDSDQPPLPGGATVGLMPFVKDLTYREVHAYTFGFVPWFLAIVTGNAALVAASVGVVIVAILGRKTKRFARVPKYVLKEPHYTLCGALSAYISASLALGFASVAASLFGVLG